MKKTVFALMCMASLAIVTACGGGNASKNAEAQEAGEQSAEAVEQTAEAALDLSKMTLFDVKPENYAELVSGLCGVDPKPGDGLEIDKAYGTPGNANLMFKGVKGIEERDLQKIVFERCQAVADGGAIYKLESSQEKGIHKGEPIKSFDDLKGFQWCYEYKGALVNCAVSKPGGMKSIDEVEVRFGR